MKKTELVSGGTDIKYIFGWVGKKKIQIMWNMESVLISRLALLKDKESNRSHGVIQITGAPLIPHQYLNEVEEDCDVHSWAKPVGEFDRTGPSKQWSLNFKDVTENEGESWGGYSWIKVFLFALNICYIFRSENHRIRKECGLFWRS